MRLPHKMPLVPGDLESAVRAMKHIRPMLIRADPNTLAMRVPSASRRMSNIGNNVLGIPNIKIPNGMKMKAFTSKNFFNCISNCLRIE